MAKKFYNNIDLDQNQILNIVLHKGGAFPSSPVDGQFFYRSDLKIVYYYNASTWSPVAVDTGANVQTVIAGAALGGGGSGASVTLDVNVDGATIEISGDAVRIKDLGVTTAKINDAAVTTIKVLDNNITFAKIQDVPTMTVIGRVAAGSGVSSGISILNETDMVSNSSTGLATQSSIKAYVDSKVASIGSLIGGFDATANTTFPGISTNKKGDYWYVTVAGTVQGVVLNVGDVLIANVPNPSPTLASNWIFVESNRDQASSTVLGLVTLATGAEVITGTDTSKVITPATLIQRTALETRTGLAAIATQTEANAGTDDAKFITSLKLKTLLDVRTGSYAANVGDGSTLSFVLTHGLNSLDVHVQLIEVATGNQVETDVQNTTTGTVTVGFTKAPATNSIRVLIKK